MSHNAPLYIFGFGLLLAVASLFLPRPRVPAAAASTITWTKSVMDEGGNLSDQTRLDLVERLGILAEPWCVDILKQAQREEHDPAIRYAIEHALKNCESGVPV